ncbi:MAG: DUF1700 domain-containing protein, partial [Propionibacteriaceae bacterium]|nr:DUF1700 domain-containing protein [Propionibacteriaceae bacterium]
MTQAEFFHALEAQLSAFADRPTYADVMDDFRAHFAEALRQGRSEDEVCRQLGDPADIAAELRDILAQDAPAPAGSPAPEPTPRPAPAGSVTARLTSATIKCHGGAVDRATVRVTLHGEPATDDVIRVEDLDGAIRLTQATEAGFVARLFRWIRPYLVEVTLPGRIAGGLDLSTQVGDIEVRDLSTGAPIEAKTFLGDVTCESAAAPALTVETKTGNAKFRRCTGLAHAESGAGDVDFTAHSGTVSASTKAGNIHAQTDVIDRPASCETAAGNISVQADRVAAALDLETQAGNIRVETTRLAADLFAVTT